MFWLLLCWAIGAVICVGIFFLENRGVEMSKTHRVFTPLIIGFLWPVFAVITIPDHIAAMADPSDD